MLGADFLILDGYNVLSAWKELHILQEQSLEHARAKLEEYMASYSTFKGFKAVIVYDGQGMGLTGFPREEALGQHLSVVFTNDGLTADSYIERRVYEILRRKKVVFVVTGDYSEQLAILGTGAFRFSVRELREDYKRSKQEMKQTGMKTRKLGRNELSGRINPAVFEKLEKLRRKKPD